MTTTPWRVILHPAAKRDLDKLPAGVYRRVSDRINLLKTNPRPRGCRKLQGTDDAFRLRVGEYRIIYRVADRESQVLIGRILHRREAYR